MSGMRVLEVAQWVMVPGAGGILADWGADVIKVEHPIRGDAVRGLYSAERGSIKNSHVIHNTNRGKRSVGIDLGTPEGRDLVLALAEDADVFLTNFLPASRERLGMDVDDVRARNENIVYACGSGVGPVGPESDTRGFDFAQFWARGGVGSVYHHPDLDYPLPGNGQFGDLISATVLAGGVAAALLERERTGVARTVDVSLLGVGAWTVCHDIIVGAAGEPVSTIPTTPRTALPNPLTNIYRTADGRFITLVLLQSDRDWPVLCEVLEAPELLHEPRFADAAARRAHTAEVVAELDAVFATRTLEEWSQRLAASPLAWAVFQHPAEVASDPQMVANGYVVPVSDVEGSTAPTELIATPVQFDRQSPLPGRAPEPGEHTEAVLADAGIEWELITSMKQRGVIN